MGGKYLKKKLTAILIFMVLTVIAILPVSGNENLNKTDKEKQHNVVFEKKAHPFNGDDVDWWPMFQHDPQNTGYTTSKGPDTNNVLWVFTASNNYGLFSCPTIVDDRVYIGGAGVTPLRFDFNGSLYCLDANTGSLLWRHKYPIHISVQATPVIVNGTVFVGLYNWEGNVGGVYCYNALDGSMLWKNENIGNVEHAPTVVNGKLYIHGNQLYCLETATGAVLWNCSVGSGCPAVVNGKIYTSKSGLVKKCVFCLNASTGDILWSWKNPLGHGVKCSPAIVNNKIYFGTQGHGSTIPGSSWIPGAMFCLNAENGTIIWQSKVRQDFANSPAIYDGKVFIGSMKYMGQNFFMFYCFDAESGEVLWERKISYLPGFMNPPFPSSPAVTDGKVYVGIPDRFSCKIYCFNTTTGENIWSYKYHGWLPMTRDPAIADGQLYIPFGTTFRRDGMIYCFADINPDAPYAPMISGPGTGSPREKYNYTITTTDPNGDDVYYYVSWGDGITEEWIGPFPSGEEVIVNHTWSEKGKYEIRIRAKDNDGLRSALGSLKVSMPKNKPVNFNFDLLSWLFERFPLGSLILRYLHGL